MRQLDYLHLLVMCLLCMLLQACTAAYKPPMSTWKPPASQLMHDASDTTLGASHNYKRDLLSKCKLIWRNATLDHFSYVRLHKMT